MERRNIDGSGFISGAARRILASWAIIGALFFMLGPAQPDVPQEIEANTFNVVDERNDVVARFGNAPGGTELRLTDPQEDASVRLAVEKGVASLTLKHRSEAAIDMRVDKQAARLEMQGAGKANKVVMTCDEKASQMQLVDRQGHVLVEVGVFADGCPGLLVRDSEGKIRARIDLTNEGDARLLLQNQNEEPVWTALPLTK